MANTETWDDNELLDYVDAHSRTERALFSRAHVRRLFVLCGLPWPRGQLANGVWLDVAPSAEFVAIPYEDAAELLKIARARLRAAARPADVPPRDPPPREPSVDLTAWQLMRDQLSRAKGALLQLLPVTPHARLRYHGDGDPGCASGCARCIIEAGLRDTP